MILCAGSINSPQLLQLSGIADPALLARLVLHCGMPHRRLARISRITWVSTYIYRSRVPTLNDQLYPLRGKIRAGIEFLLRRRGPLSMSVNQGGGFIRSSADKPAAGSAAVFQSGQLHQYPHQKPAADEPGFFPGVLLSFNSCRPTSRGHLAIRSADPQLPPAIFPNYLSTERDVAEVCVGVRLLRTIAATAPLAGLIEREIQPGVQLQSDQELLADFRQRAGSVFHPVGTCAMGNDPARAVVDARLRVHGLVGLRVVDASVFP